MSSKSWSACATASPLSTKVSWSLAHRWMSCARAQKPSKMFSSASSAPSAAPRAWTGCKVWYQARAIVWAQARTVRNYLPRSNIAGTLFSGLAMALLYGVFVFLGVVAAILLANPDDMEFARRVLPAALLLCFLYWQVIPILMASTGASLDIRKLLVYPIPHRQLFTLEVLLRVTSGLEILILLT